MLEIQLDTLPLHVQMKLLRTVSGDSVAAVAARWGKSVAYVYRVERGDAAPTPLEVKDAREAAEAASAANDARALAEAVEVLPSTPHERKPPPRIRRPQKPGQPSRDE